MEYFEKLALDLAVQKPSLYLRYVDDIFVACLIVQSGYTISSATAII
jgi:hypothetical protein